jgi:hypothetical protein
MTLRYFFIFLFGVIFTFFFFGSIIPLIPNLNINYTVQSSKSDWVISILTLLSLLGAFAIAIWGQRFHKLGNYKANIKIVKSIENIQENDRHEKQGHTRLIFENTGKNIAEDVEVYVDKIYDNNNLRNDFISVPLTWTHSGLFKRSFQEKQYGYLDLCRIDNIDDKNDIPKLVLTAGAGIPNYQDLNEGNTILRLMIFQKDERRKIYKIHLNWKKGKPFIHVAKIVKII